MYRDKVNVGVLVNVGVFVGVLVTVGVGVAVIGGSGLYDPSVNTPVDVCEGCGCCVCVEIGVEVPVYRDWETDRKSTRLNSSHSRASRMPSSA